MIILSLILIVAIGRGEDVQITVPRKGIGVGVVSSGINGSFYDPPTGRFASLLYFHGKWYSWYPNRRIPKLGGLVCYEDGRVVGGYFSLTKSNILLFNGKPFSEKGVLWALTGGGLYVLNGKLLPLRKVRQEEWFSDLRIYYHRHFSFIFVFREKSGGVKVGLGVSKGFGSPERVAQYLSRKYSLLYFLRLDGGSSTTYWRHRPPPNYIHHGFFFAHPPSGRP